MRSTLHSTGRRGSRLLARLARDVVINALAASVMVPPPLRALTYRLYGIRIESWNIRAHCWFTGNQVTISRAAFINHGCYFDEMAPITIGERCQVAPGVAFITSGHAIGEPSQRAGDIISAPIRVGAGCWIGARAMLLSGVTVGEGCVIAAGAVVTSDCAPNGLYGGVPARRLRDLPV